MENEYGKITQDNRLIDRLKIYPTTYGYNLFDRKIEKRLLSNKSKETCLEGIRILQNNPYNVFEEFIEKVKDEVIVNNTILICKEKHGDMIYSIPTINDLYKVSLHILQKRVNINYIQKWDLPTDELDYNEDDIEKMPKSFQEKAREELKHHKQNIKSYVDNNKMYDLTIKALDEKNGALAFRILQFRTDYEYEEFEIVEPIVVTDE